MSAQEIYTAEQADRRDARIPGFMLKGMGVKDAESAVNAEDIRVENLKRTHLNGESSSLTPADQPYAPIDATNVQLLLNAQFYQLKHNQELGVYARIDVLPDANGGTELIIASRVPMPLPDRFENEINQPDHIGLVRDRVIFSSLTLTLCHANKDFSDHFSAAYAARRNNPNLQETEKESEKQAFADSLMQAPVIDRESSLIKDMRNHAATKTKLVATDAAGQGFNPKAQFLNTLSKVLTGQDHQNNNVQVVDRRTLALDLFEQGQNDLIRQNTGFIIGWLRNLFGAQTKTMKFATTFFNHQPTQANVNVENPLNRVMAAEAAQ